MVRHVKSSVGKKALSNYFKAQDFYLEHVEKLVEFDHEKVKPDSVQYVPILSALKFLLQHEDVLGHVCENHTKCQGNTMTNYSQGSLFRKKKTIDNCAKLFRNNSIL